MEVKIRELLFIFVLLFVTCSNEAIEIRKEFKEYLLSELPSQSIDSLQAINIYIDASGTMLPIKNNENYTNLKKKLIVTLNPLKKCVNEFNFGTDVSEGFPEFFNQQFTNYIKILRKISPDEYSIIVTDGEFDVGIATNDSVPVFVQKLQEIIFEKEQFFGIFKIAQLGNNRTLFCFIIGPNYSIKFTELIFMEYLDNSMVLSECCLFGNQKKDPWTRNDYVEYTGTESLIGEETKILHKIKVKNNEFIPYQLVLKPLVNFNLTLTDSIWMTGKRYDYNANCIDVIDRQQISGHISSINDFTQVSIDSLPTEKIGEWYYWIGVNGSILPCIKNNPRLIYLKDVLDLLINHRIKPIWYITSIINVNRS